MSEQPLLVRTPEKSDVKPLKALDDLALPQRVREGLVKLR
jgi:hypothetical protein